MNLWHYLEVEIRIQHHQSRKFVEWRFNIGLRHLLCFLMHHWTKPYDTEYWVNGKYCRLCRRILDFGTITEEGKKLAGIKK